MKAPLVFGLLGSVLLTAGAVQAGISINNAIVDFRPGDRPVKDVLVRNHDGKPAFIEVTVVRVTEPGSQPEKQEPLGPKENTLLVSPRKLVIPPNGEKLVRIISRHQPLATDAVYRATLTPVVPEHQTGGKIGVQVVVAYGLLIFIRPQKLERRLEAERNGTMISFYNRGNTNLELRDGEQCITESTGETRCEAITGHRIYAGRSISLTLPFDAPIQFRYRMAGEFFVEAFE